MATSGSTDFTLIRDQIISGALRKVKGVNSYIEPHEIESGAEALNLIVKGLQNFHVFLWSSEEKTLNLVIGDADYDLAADTLNVENVFYRDANNDQNIKLVTKFEYLDIYDKTVTGKPQIVWLERKESQPTFHFWPAPDGAYVVHYQRVRKLQDFDDHENNADFPERWLEFLVYRLAQRIAPEYGLPIDERAALKNEADALFSAAQAGNKEPQDEEYLKPAY